MMGGGVNPGGTSAGVHACTMWCGHQETAPYNMDNGTFPSVPQRVTKGKEEASMARELVHSVPSRGGGEGKEGRDAAK